jgi:hypothetical protein
LVVKIIAESLSQHDEKHVVPTPLGGIRVGGRWKCNRLETMTQPNIYVLERGASNEVQRIIDQKFFLKSDINVISQFFCKTKFKPISKRLFEFSEEMRILNIRHVITR